MIKKAILVTGIFAATAMSAATMTYAQTATPTTSATTIVTLTVEAMAPDAAPATGRAK